MIYSILQMSFLSSFTTHPHNAVLWRLAAPIVTPKTFSIPTYHTWTYNILQLTKVSKHGHSSTEKLSLFSTDKCVHMR